MDTIHDIGFGNHAMAYSTTPKTPKASDTKKCATLDCLSPWELYDHSTEAVTPQLNYNTETVTDSFYDGIVNPMYNFESPYGMQDYASEETTEKANATNRDVRDYKDESRLYTANGHISPRPGYNGKGMAGLPGWQFNGYPCNGGYRPGVFPGYNTTSPMVARFMMYPHMNTTPGNAEFDMGATRHMESHENQDTRPTSVGSSYGSQSSPPSVVTEVSPMLKPEPVPTASGTGHQFASGPNQQPATGQIDLNATKGLPPVPLVFRNGYNGDYYGYPATSPGDDIYNQTYVEPTAHGGDKHVDAWYNGWSDTPYTTYVPMAGNHTPKNSMSQRLSVTPRSYSVPQTNYPPTVVYNVGTWGQKGYPGEVDTQNGYGQAADGMGCYESSADFATTKSDDYMETGMITVNGGNLDPSGTSHHGSQVPGAYGDSYKHAAYADGFYAQQNMGTPTHASAADAYPEEPVELPVDSGDSNASEMTMEALKGINRNNIDFLRMSDALWQALRSTGMFKLGNKGRAILKSKISKQLKLNPQLRMRAMCISGVRRATTRQLFQLAQICGIKSHLK
ncbi:AT hook motif-containing protein, putative [Babesia caballi]|uniref:AT hook motif-containing protein, putative n=1 Tax=Babesia caballi TaxID=5871 RepID=A0AAV4M4D4_BABCB|nr:AT hook motif-containing protein, putative [Babesia caballi]